MKKCQITDMKAREIIDNRGIPTIRVDVGREDLYQRLMAHAVTRPLKAVGDAVITGPTGTNVNDLVVAVIL